MIDEKELCRKAALHDALKGKGIYKAGQITPSEELTKQIGVPVSIISTRLETEWAMMQFEDRIIVNELNADGTIGKFNAVYMYDDYSVDWTTGTWMSQEDYENLIKYGDNDFDGASEQTIKEWIADEFGFDVNKIKILNEIDVWVECKSNGGGRLIRTDTAERKPYYSSTDCNYVRFNVMAAGYWFYEAHNGMLRMVED